MRSEARAAIVAEITASYDEQLTPVIRRKEALEAFKDALEAKIRMVVNEADDLRRMVEEFASKDGQAGYGTDLCDVNMPKVAKLKASID